MTTGGWQKVKGQNIWRRHTWKGHIFSNISVYLCKNCNIVLHTLMRWHYFCQATRSSLSFLTHPYPRWHSILSHLLINTLTPWENHQMHVAAAVNKNLGLLDSWHLSMPAVSIVHDTVTLCPYEFLPATLCSSSISNVLMISHQRCQYCC